MARINNSDVTKNLIDGAKIQLNQDTVPSQLAEKVVPVMEVNPKLLKNINVIKSIQKSNTGNTSIYKTPSNKDFFLTNLSLAYQADSSSDATYTRITLTQNKEVKYLLYLPKLSLTNAQDSAILVLPIPIKVDRNTDINVASSFTAGNINISAGIMGYTVED